MSKTIFEEIEASIFDKDAEDIDKSVENFKDSKNIDIEDRAIYVVKYRKLYTSPSKQYAVVRRIGWDSKAGAEGGTNKFYVMATATRTVLDQLFHTEADAREFVNKMDQKKNNA